MDPFVEKLPVSRKAVRSQLIRQKLIDVAARGDLEQLRSIFDSVVQLGRKWEHLLIKIVAEQIENEPTSALAQVAAPFLDTLTRVDLVLRGKETGAHLQDLEGMLRRLEQIRPKPGLLLNVNFETQFAYVYGLCAIVAWAAENARSLSLESRHPRVENFLQRAGIIEAFQDPASEPKIFDTETVLGFTRINPGKRFETDVHAGRLVGLFRKHMELSVPTAQALSISFAELIENAVKHGEITTPAWLFANYHPQPRIMHVCICDRGLGVRKTFENSSNPRLRELALKSTEWIREATEPLVTSKSEGHAGYGLYLARELCRTNGGTFAILSGNAAFGIHPRNPDSAVSEVEELQELNVPWQGTLVALQFHLDRPLDLGPIYETLPAPDWADDSPDEVSLFDD